MHVLRVQTLSRLTDTNACSEISEYALVSVDMSRRICGFTALLPLLPPSIILVT